MPDGKTRPPAAPYRVGVRLADWAQGFGNRLYGGILDFIRSGVVPVS